MGESDGRKALGGIIADLRDKLIEEGWFGRRPVEPRHDPLAALGWELPRGECEDALSRVPDEFFAPRPPFEEQWAARQPSDTPEHEPPDHDIDR